MVDAYDGAGGRPTLQAVGPNGEDGIWRPVLTTLRRRFEFLRSMVRRNSLRERPDLVRGFPKSQKFYFSKVDFYLISC